MRRCKHHIFFIALKAVLFLAATPVQAQEGPDEFSGPLSGWANIKSRFGAKGDGKTDDTKALQRALDSLSVYPKDFNMGKQGFVVIYLPKGVYRISQTLVLKGKIGVSFIGEDPANTTIQWSGPDKDTMFWANGSAYFRISRLCWNPGNAKEMEAIGIHWKNMWNDKFSQSFASLNIEIADCRFEKGFRFAVSGGTFQEDGTSHNDSEITIRRCTFLNATEAAVKIRGYNALDYWIWDCRFYDCKNGVDCTSGNFHVYRSFFCRSTFADFHISMGYYTSVRGCYSFGSRMFSADEGFSSNPFKRIFQDNKVVLNTNVSIQYPHLGKLTFLDNTFGKTKDTANPYNVNYYSWAPGNYQVLSVNNKYEYRSPVMIVPKTKELFSYGDRLQQKPVLNDTAAFLSGLQKTPVYRNRTVFTVPPGAGDDEIQQLINKAAAMSGKRPVLYFPFGNYVLKNPVFIPAGSDLQLLGDGIIYSSVLLTAPGFPEGKSMIYVKGPTGITIKDLHLGQNSGIKSKVNLISFENVDQPGSFAFVDQIYSAASNTLNLEGLSNLTVQKENTFFSTGDRVIGDGKGGKAALYAFGGQFVGVQVDKGGTFVAKDCWWEGEINAVSKWEGTGNITIDGGMIAPNGASADKSVIQIGWFKGKVTLLNMYLQGGMLIGRESPDLSFFGWNLHYYHKMYPMDFLGGSRFKALFSGLTVQCFDNNNPDCHKILTVDDRVLNVKDKKAFILEHLTDTRKAKPQAFVKRAAKASIMFISRVTIGNCDKGIVFGK